MPRAESGEGVLALDLGTSSVRAVVYNARGAMLAKTLTDLPYKVRTTDAGEVSSDPDALVTLIAQSIDGALKAARKEKIAILGVGASCYWHSLMGVDRAGRPTTELLTWADTRSAPETRGMRARFDERAYHARTGCFFHASYWPAKLRWLRASRRGAVRRTARWISLGEYLYQQLHGDTRVSHSIASGTGLLDVNRCQWDAAALRLAGITPDHLSALSDWDRPAHSLRPTFAKRWPELRDAPWYLPLGDGGLANIGAGCVSPRWACATVGTSSALRVLLDRPRLTVPWGTFVYRVDRRRFVLGGALSEGGNVVRWFSDNLGLKPKKKFERAAAAMAADSHGLTVLPFWAGERSPNWRGDARAVIAGLSLGTQPAQLLRAAMEAITYQLVAVAAAMQRVVPAPDAVIATGGQLIHSPAWTQMLADALNVRVTTSPEREASSRGAALLVLHALGKLPKLWSTTPGRGRSYRPRPALHARYQRARSRQQHLYELFFPPPTAAAGSGSRTRDLRSPAAKR
ncbi:MAG: carbohydrate kinase [Chloroflexi bacterium]|nr:MAG: carbohydrate kinase [Chloroflexota bacterium]